MFKEGTFYEKGKIIERIAIRTPVWDGRQVGIATYKAERSDICEVKILHRRVNDKQLYPKIMSIPSKQVMKYPQKLIKDSNIWVYMVPIAEMVEVRSIKYMLKGGSNGIKGSY